MIAAGSQFNNAVVTVSGAMHTANSIGRDAESSVETHGRVKHIHKAGSSHARLHRHDPVVFINSLADDGGIAAEWMNTFRQRGSGSG